MEMTDEQQRARSWKYSSQHSCNIVQLAEDTFALFIPGQSFEHWIGPGAQLAEAITTRPIPAKRAEPIPSSTHTQKELAKNLFSSFDL